MKMVNLDKCKPTCTFFHFTLLLAVKRATLMPEILGVCQNHPPQAVYWSAAADADSAIRHTVVMLAYSKCYSVHMLLSPLEAEY